MTENTPLPLDLLPCPFCGGDADGPNYDDEYDLHLVRCKDSADCGSGIWQHSESEAIAAWNRRGVTGAPGGEGVTQADRDLFISISRITPDGVTAGKIHKGLLFTAEIEEIAAYRRAAAITAQPDPRDAEIERLTKEADDHAEAASRWRSEAGNSEAEIGRLREALAKAEADAARYQWLRDNSCPPHNFYISVPDEFHGICYSPQEVDAYIDEARAALAKSEGK